jgi:hypothetical protein
MFPVPMLVPRRRDYQLQVNCQPTVALFLLKLWPGPRDAYLDLDACRCQDQHLSTRLKIASRAIVCFVQVLHTPETESPGGLHHIIHPNEAVKPIEPAGLHITSLGGLVLRRSRAWLSMLPLHKAVAARQNVILPLLLTRHTKDARSIHFGAAPPFFRAPSSFSSNSFWHLFRACLFFPSH